MPSNGPAQLAPGVKDDLLPYFKLAGTDIDSVLQSLETYTGRTVLHPTALPTGTYTINIDRPIPKSELIIALETLLFENNVAVVPLGDRFLKVVPLPTARSEAPEYLEGSTLNLPPSSRLGTKLFQLKFLRASEIFAGGPGGGIQGILSLNIGSPVVVLAQANAALVTDSVTNLQRIETLLGSIDQPNLEGFQPKFYQLANAKASDVATKIHTLITGPLAQQLGTATSINADDRTNQIIVIADAREIPFFDELITKMDAASDANTNTDVIYLKHADANTLGPVLTQLITGQAAAAQKANSTTGRPGELQTVDRTNPAPTPAVNPAAPTPNAANAALAAAREENGGAAFSPFVTVVADERSNSIVVSGEKNDIRLMHDLVTKLDEALPQVAIQVIVAEVTLSDTDVSGISALGLTVGQQNGATHLINWAGGGTGSASVPGTSIAGWDFTGGVVNPLAFNAALNASSAGSKNVVHVLEAPIIMTAHGKQADVNVGEQVPIITGAQTTLATTGTTPVATESTSYTNVTIDLNVTPLIGDNGDVQLTIDQKVQDIVSYTTIDGNQQPNIGVREAKSFVTVKDGQMIVLGGMQRTSKSSTQNKLGFLYEIPILSQLLGGHTDDLERTELLFFIRPKIITPEEGTQDVIERINQMTNRDQINGFLKNPTPQPESKMKNFLDRFNDKDN